MSLSTLSLAKVWAAPLLDIMKLSTTPRTSSVLKLTRTGPQKPMPSAPPRLRKLSSTEATACTWC